MYRLVTDLNDEAFYRLCLQAFREMRAAGITAVGEFHYFHHSKNATDYEFDRLLLKAAGAVGIRIVLLNAYYKTGGIGQPLGAAQQRFRTSSPEEYWRNFDRLQDELEDPTQSLGAVVHSLRAASLEDIGQLHAESVRRSIPFHIHVEEQQKEVADSIAAYGKPPMAALDGVMRGMHNVTAVHCTHTDPADMARFLNAGGTACICPTTEGNLGDGVPELPGHHPADGRITLGTDSNLRICMTEEMRWLEYGQRLANQSRGMHTDGTGSTARRLLQIATANGAKSLGLDAGRIEAGAWADFAAIDLAVPALRGCDETTLLDALVFGTANGAVAETCVGGRWDDLRTR